MDKDRTKRPMTTLGGKAAAAKALRLSVLALLPWLAIPPAAYAQPADKVYRLGFRASGGATASTNPNHEFVVAN
jgi:hypothetical protein